MPNLCYAMEEFGLCTHLDPLRRYHWNSGPRPQAFQQLWDGLAKPLLIPQATPLLLEGNSSRCRCANCMTFQMRSEAALHGGIIFTNLLSSCVLPSNFKCTTVSLSASNFSLLNGLHLLRRVWTNPRSNTPQALPKYIGYQLKFVSVGVAFAEAFFHAVLHKAFTLRLIPLSVEILPVDLHWLEVWLSQTVLFIRSHSSLQGGVASEYLIAILWNVCRVLDTKKGMQMFPDKCLRVIGQTGY